MTVDRQLAKLAAELSAGMIQPIIIVVYTNAENYPFLSVVSTSNFQPLQYARQIILESPPP